MVGHRSYTITIRYVFNAFEILLCIVYDRALHGWRRATHLTARTFVLNVTTSRKITIIIVGQCGATSLSFALSPNPLITAMTGKKNTHGGRCRDNTSPTINCRPHRHHIYYTYTSHILCLWSTLCEKFTIIICDVSSLNRLVLQAVNLSTRRRSVVRPVVGFINRTYRIYTSWSCAAFPVTNSTPVDLPLLKLY